MSALAFKVKTKNGQHVLKDLTSASTVGELKIFLFSISGVELDKICVLSGFPPKPLDISNDEQTLAEIGLKTGETLIVDERQRSKNDGADKTASKPEKSPQKPVANGVTLHEPIMPAIPIRPGILMKKVVPSDNSCLFTSIGKCLITL